MARYVLLVVVLEFFLLVGRCSFPKKGQVDVGMFGTAEEAAVARAVALGELQAAPAKGECGVCASECPQVFSCELPASSQVLLVAHP